MIENFDEISYVQPYRFVGIQKNRQEEIFNIISCCKEIRDTAYPIKDSFVTQLEIRQFVAVKEKDMISVSGDLMLVDSEVSEKRYFEAYIMDNGNEVRVYLDVTRFGTTDEPRVIRTSEVIKEKKNRIEVVTKYEHGDVMFEQNYSNVLSRQEYEEEVRRSKFMEVSTLC